MIIFTYVASTLNGVRGHAKRIDEARSEDDNDNVNEIDVKKIKHVNIRTVLSKNCTLILSI